MAKLTTHLYKNRSATQEFLFSPSDEIIDDVDASAVVDAAEHGDTPSLKAHFPEMLDRQALADAVEARMGDASTLIALAFEIVSPPPTETDDARPADNLVQCLNTIDTRCQTHDGAWARIDRDRFACVLPHLGEIDAQAMARELLGTIADRPHPPITIGSACYPTIDYTRGQVLENAEKALEHTGFFGQGTHTGFDAVSLNISGDRHYQGGDVAGAIDEFKNGLRLDPTDVNLHNSLGVCYGILKDYDKALATFEQAIDLAPQEMMARYNKGYILLLKDQPEAALTCFLEADAREPNVFEVVFHIGQTHMEMDDADRARPFLETATRINGRSGPALKSLGACLHKLDFTKEATQAYKGVVKLNPTDAESLSALGRLYVLREESLDVAAVLCEQSVRLEPENGLYRHRLGHAYLSEGRLEDARAAFERAETLGHDSRAQIDMIRDRLAAAKAS